MGDEIDLVKLLQKYMQHVFDEEGVTYIEEHMRYSKVKFTDNEWDRLQEIWVDIDEKENNDE